MKIHVLWAVVGFVVVTSFGAKAQPRPKTKEELEALQAMFNATTPDGQIAAATNVLEKFADTQFKSIALQMISSDYEKKGDFPKAVTFGERALEADPKNYEAMIILGREYARNTHDTDFDRDAKLKKATDYANNALATIKVFEKPANVPDDRWQQTVNGVNSDAHDVLGLAAMVRKDAKAAVAEYTLAVAASPDPVIYARLAQADNIAGSYDEAIVAAEKAMSLPNAPASVKSVAQAERARAVQLKAKAAGSAKPATPAAAPTAPAAPPAPAAPSTPPR